MSTRAQVTLFGIGLLGCSKPADPGSRSSMMDDRTDTGIFSSTDTGEGSSSLPGHQAIFVVHLEPGAIPRNSENGTPSTTRAEDYFDDLLSLVYAADQYDHKLTLMFTPQWAHYLSQDICDNGHAGPTGHLQYQGTEYENCLALVRAMQEHGHELAVHHHPLGSPAGWDGYTSETTWTADRTPEPGEETYFSDGGGPHGPDPFHLGHVDDLYESVQRLSGGTDIVSATTEEFPDAVRFSVAGGPAAYTSFTEPGDLLSQPCATSHAEHWVWELRMRLFTSATAQSTVLESELPMALNDLENRPEYPRVLGFVTHAKNVHETGIDGFEQLFSELHQNGIVATSTQNAALQYPRASDPPESQASTYGCDLAR